MLKRLSLALLVMHAIPALALEPVDLELVLAVDTSRSMDYDELRIQRDGYAAALEHPAVTSALTMGPLGKTAIYYMEWGGPDRQRVLIDWTVVASAEDAARLADELRWPPLLNQSGTSISGALLAAAAAIEGNDYAGTRRVIDVSGDGPNNRGIPVEQARDLVAAKGIEINGLPFMVKRPGHWYNIRDLDLYYQDCVITGEMAFVIPVVEIDRLVVSIRQKLVLEISGLRPPPVPRIYPAARSDCLIGEKKRQRANDAIYDGSPVGPSP